MLKIEISSEWDLFQNKLVSWLEYLKQVSLELLSKWKEWQYTGFYEGTFSSIHKYWILASGKALLRFRLCNQVVLIWGVV